jgi:hypothetical protein
MFLERLVERNPQRSPLFDCIGPGGFTNRRHRARRRHPGFRPQTFVTRARTQAVASVHGGVVADLRPAYDQEGRRVEGVS